MSSKGGFNGSFLYLVRLINLLGAWNDNIYGQFRTHLPVGIPLREEWFSISSWAYYYYHAVSAVTRNLPCFWNWPGRDRLGWCVLSSCRPSHQGQSKRVLILFKVTKRSWAAREFWFTLGYIVINTRWYISLIIPNPWAVRQGGYVAFVAIYCIPQITQPPAGWEDVLRTVDMCRQESIVAGW